MEDFVETKFCYDPNWEKREPPFHLAIDPRFFQIAQFPSFSFPDTFVFNSLENFTQSSQCILDFYIYEKQFSQDITFLLDVIFPYVQDSRFSRIATVLSSILTKINEYHLNLISQFTQLMAESSSTYIASIVHYLTGNKILLNLHQDYFSKLNSLNPLDTAFSAAESTHFSKELDGRPLIMIIHSPIRWFSVIIDFCQKFANTLPTNDPLASNILQYGSIVSEFLVDTDSIPKLEQVAKSFIKEPFPIVQTGRSLIRIGHAYKQCRKATTERTIILFSDVFVYAQPKGNVLLAPAFYWLNNFNVSDSSNEKKFCS